MASGNIVKLNVGGTMFMTTRSTLLNFDGYFRNMMKSQLPHETDDTGCIFIDRDPSHFQAILNFLRDGQVPVPQSSYKKDQLLQEATFYMLDGLIYLCGGTPSETWARQKGLIKEKPEVPIAKGSFDSSAYREKFRKTFAVEIPFRAGAEGELESNRLVNEYVQKYSGTWKIIFVPRDSFTTFGISKPHVAWRDVNLNVRERADVGQCLERVQSEMLSSIE